MKKITTSAPDEVADKARYADLSREPDWATARAIVAEMAARTGGLSGSDFAWAEGTLGIRSTSDPGD